MNPLPNPDFSALLAAQEPFLRGLSRGLIANDLDADEAVQGTLLAAWRARDRPASQWMGAEPLQGLGPERLRAWLAVALRRKAISIHRKRRPEKSLEGELGADLALDEERFSPHAIAARTERQQKLTEALMQLQEEPRDAIVLRFQDGMSVAQIARMRGESANTVQSRVRRGLDELKRSLQQTTDDRDREDGYEPWLSAIIPLAFPAGAPAGLMVRLAGASAPVASTATSSILLSLLTMGLMKNLVVVTALILGAGVYFKRIDSTASPRVPITVSTELADSSTLQPPAQALSQKTPSPGREALTTEPADFLEQASTADSEAPAQVAATDQRISGRVLFMDGLPIPGAEVTASTGGKRSDHEFGRATSELDGRFELILEAESVPETLTLTVDMGRFESRDAGFVAVAPGASDVELRIDALMYRLVPHGGYPTETDATWAAFLSIRAMEKRIKGADRSGGRYDSHLESTKTRLAPTGPPYIFHLSRGADSRDDQVAFLPAAAPAGFYELQLAGDAQELGSVTISLTGAEIPTGADVKVRVSLRSEAYGTWSVSTQSGARQVRKSGEYPGPYRVKAEVRGEIPFGWVLPEVVDKSIEVRAGEDTSVEVCLVPAGMARLTVIPPATSGEAAYEPGDSLDITVLYRVVGAPDWELAPLDGILQDGATTSIGFPVAVEPFLIGSSLRPGPYEVKLMGSAESVVGPFVLDVLGGQYNDLRIQLPTGM